MNPEANVASKRTPPAPEGVPASRQFIHPQFSLQENLCESDTLVWAEAEDARAIAEPSATT
jgi:hypothetical protein